MASPFGMAILLTEADSLENVLPPNSNSLVCLGNTGLKNIWRLTGTSNSCSWLSLSVILCVVVYDNRSKSIMAMSLHMNLCALFMIRVFPSLCSRLAWCSRKMLLVPSWDRAHLPFSDVLWKTRCHGISLWVLSLATSWNKGGSYLVTDQTVWADSLPKIFLFIFYFIIFFFEQLFIETWTWAGFFIVSHGSWISAFQNMLLHTFTNIFVKEIVGYLCYFHLFINIASLYEMMEEWLPSWINATSTSVQYTYFFVVMICCSRHHANCMWGLMFIV